MKLFGKNKKEKQNLDQQIGDQLLDFATSQRVRSESLNVLESDKDFKIILESIDGLILLLKTGIEAKFKDNKNINLSTLKDLLNRKIHMTLYGYDPVEESVTLQNGEKHDRRKD
jgi:hypothetical protein